MARRRPDWGLVVALTWAMVALIGTLLLAPQLGLRGWLWLGLHHLVCLVGVTHELVRAWGRRAARLSAPS